MDDLKQLVAQTGAITASTDRGDLGARLEKTMQRLAEPGVRVLVVGEFKQGKSLLVNALINADVCPVDDDVATAVPTIVRHGEESATLVYAGNRPDDELPPPLERRAVPLEELEQYVAERGNPDNERRLACAEVSVPRRILENGLVLVDTPGVGGIGSAHAASTIAELPLADAVLMVSDAGQEYSEPEIDFLRQAVKLCPNVGCVLTKTDIYPQWRRIAELDRVHLASIGVTAPLMPVASTLRLQALATNDRLLHRESGFPTLIGYVQNQIMARAEQLARRSVAHDIRYVSEHVYLSLQGELAVLRDPARNQELLERLEKARTNADDLKKRSARWQTTLNDGIIDLQADIEYDMRDRTRLIIREAEEIVNASDPAQIAEQFDEWFQQRTAEAVADNFVWAHERSEWLAAQVADHFAQTGGAALPDLHIADTSGVLDPVREMPKVEQDSISFVGKVLIGMRGSYGGVLMFGLLTGLMGMALVNPLSVGAGVILGKRAYNEDRYGRLKKRRFDTMTVVRRQADEIILHVIKQAKDRLRQVQRALRDHYLDVADELQRSLSDSITAAQKSVKTGAEDREKRIAEITKVMGELERIDRQAQALANQPAPQLSA